VERPISPIVQSQQAQREELHVKEEEKNIFLL
jgi:hypothetical protein